MTPEVPERKGFRLFHGRGGAEAPSNTRILAAHGFANDAGCIRFARRIDIQRAKKCLRHLFHKLSGPVAETLQQARCDVSDGIMPDGPE